MSYSFRVYLWDRMYRYYQPKIGACSHMAEPMNLSALRRRVYDRVLIEVSR